MFNFKLLLTFLPSIFLSFGKLCENVLLPSIVEYVCRVKKAWRQENYLGDFYCISPLMCLNSIWTPWDIQVYLAHLILIICSVGKISNCWDALCLWSRWCDNVTTSHVLLWVYKPVLSAIDAFYEWCWMSDYTDRAKNLQQFWYQQFCFIVW